MSRRYTTEFVITGDSSSGVQASQELQRAQSDLTREMQRAERQSQQVSQSFESVSVHARRLASVGATTAAAMGAMAVSQTRNIAEQAALARSIGVTVQTLQQWEFAAQAVNLGAGKMGDIFKDVSEKIGDFVTTGGGEAADLFERLNLNINELMGMSPDRQLLAIGEALDDVATQGEKIFFMESLASDASRLIPLMENNAELLREQIGLADQLGVSLPQSDIDSIELANQALNELVATGTGFANEVAATWAPGIVQFSGAVQGTVQELGGMGEIVETVTDFTVLLSGVLAGRLVGSLGAATLASVRKAQADRAVAAQAGITAEREAGAALATARRAEAERVAAVNSATIAAQRAQRATAEAAEKLRSIQLTQQQMTAERVLETQRLQAQITATGRAQSLTRLAEIRRAEMALTTQSAAAQKALTAAEAQGAASTRTLSAAKVDLTRATAATNSAVAANTAAVAANTGAQRAMTAASRGAAGAMALVGGPLGVATLAATAFFLFRDSSDDVSESLVNMDEPLESVIDDFKTLSTESQRAALIKWGDRQEEEADKARQALAKIREEVLSLGFEDSTGAQARVFFAEINAGFDAVESGAQSLDEMLSGLQEQLNIPDGVMRDLRLLAAEYSAGRVSADELGGRLEALTDTFNNVSAGAESAGESVNQNAPSATTIDAWGQYNDKLRESIAAALDGGSAVGAANRALDGMGDDISGVMRGYTLFLTAQDEALKDQKKAQEAAATAATQATSDAERNAQRQAQAAEQAATAQAKALLGIQQEMAPLLKDHETYIERLGVLDKALADGTISEEAYGEAVRWSAEQYTRAASGAEDYEKQTQSLVDKYDSHNQKARQLRDELEQINRRYSEGEIGAQQYARMVDGVRESQYQLALEANDLAKIFDDFVENTGERLDDAGRDWFRGLFDGTRSAMDGLKALVLDGAAEIANALLLRPLTVQITGQLQGLLGQQLTGLPSRGSAGGFDAGSLGSLKNGWDTVSGLWGGGSAAASTAAAGYTGALGLGTATGYGGALGSAVSGAAAAGGGFMSAAGAAMPWLAGGMLVDDVLGLGIVDGIVSGISGLFGSDRKSYGQIGSQIGGDDTAGDGVYRYDRNDRSKGWVQDSALGTIGVTKKQKTDDDLLIGTVAQVAKVDNLVASVMDAAQLEKTRAALDGWTSSKTKNIGTLFDERISAVVAATDSIFEGPLSALNGENLVQGLVGGLQVENVGGQMAAAVAADMNAEFRAALAAGSDIAAATQSILSSAQAVQTLGGAAERLGLQFDATAAGALDAAGGLAARLGGADNLNSLLTGYYDAFYNEQEKFDNLASDLRGTFNDMGRELPDTREGVRELVEGLQLMGAAGQEQLATILQLNQPLSQYITALEEQRGAVEGATGSITDYSDAIRTQDSLERELLRAQGDTEALRQREIDSLREIAGAEKYGLVALQERIWAIEDEAVAMEQLAARSQLIDRASLYSAGIVDGVDDALDAYNEQMELASEVARQREQQLRDERDAIQQLGNLLDSLALSDQSILDPAQRLQEAQRQFAELQVRAENGDTEAAGQMQGASSAYLDAASAYYGQSSSQYANIFNDVTGSVRDLEDSFGESIAMLGSIEAIEQKMLREQQSAVGTLRDSLGEYVEQTTLLGSISELIAMLPESLGSVIEGILPEQSSSAGSFNEAAYLANKTEQVNSIGYQGRTDWTHEQVLDAINRDYGSVQKHYDEIGRSEGVQPFATGAAFTNGIVQRPTLFDMGLMGEDGAEAIMPLTNIGGKLGVRAELPMPPMPIMSMGLGAPNQPAVNLGPLARELNALRQEVAQLRAERRRDAEQAAEQRSEQVREQRKGNRNSKQKQRVPTL